MLLLPRKVLAAILVGQKEPLVIGQVEFPRALAYGQVLVKVHYSGICGSQIGEIDGVKGSDAYLPHLLGHEGSGEVLAVGDGVINVKPSDHVVMHWMPGAGIESATPVYTWEGRRVNAGWVTTFNEYAVVSENRVTNIPKEFDLGLAALFGCAVTTGLGVINNKAQLHIGQSILVLGAGGVGLNIIQGAAMVSANPIIAVDRYADKLVLARKLGATHTINSTMQDLAEAAGKILGSKGADVVVDNTGNPQVIEVGYGLTGSKGRMILVGVLPKGKEVSLNTLPLHFGKTLTGTKGGECRPHLDIPRYVQLSQAGKLTLNELITDRAELKGINGVIDRMRRGEVVGRCLIGMY